MNMISALIPVYKESGLLETLLNQLIEDPYKDKEIITVIDEPTENSLKTVKKYKKQVKFIINKQRKGKVRALNEVAKIAKGDIFLFIDGDTIISENTKNFLEKIAEQMKKADIIDIKKNVIKNNSIFSKAARFESVCSTLTAYLSSKAKMCLGVCGQGFALKRKFFEELGGFPRVVAEDLEIGIQSFLRNKVYRFCTDVEVCSSTAPSFRSWIRQRERWGIGLGYYFKRYWKTLIKKIFEYPKSAVVLVYYAWPTLFSLLSVLLLDSFIGKALMLSLITLSLRFSFLIPITFVLSMGIIFFRNILLFLSAYIFSSLIFYITSRKFGYKFSNREFAIYYFIYSPISFIIYHYNFLRALFSSEQIALKDWKV